MLQSLSQNWLALILHTSFLLYVCSNTKKISIGKAFLQKKGILRRIGKGIRILGKIRLIPLNGLVLWLHPQMFCVQRERRKRRRFLPPFIPSSSHCSGSSLFPKRFFPPLNFEAGKERERSIFHHLRALEESMKPSSSLCSHRHFHASLHFPGLHSLNG